MYAIHLASHSKWLLHLLTVDVYKSIAIDVGNETSMIGAISTSLPVINSKANNYTT